MMRLTVDNVPCW